MNMTKFEHRSQQERTALNKLPILAQLALNGGPELMTNMLPYLTAPQLQPSRVPYSELETLLPSSVVTALSLYRGARPWPDFDPLSIYLLHISGARQQFLDYHPRALNIETWDGQSLLTRLYNKDGTINTNFLLNLDSYAKNAIEPLKQWNHLQNSLLALKTQHSTWAPYTNQNLPIMVAMATKNIGYLMAIKPDTEWAWLLNNGVDGQSLLHHAVASNSEWLIDEALSVLNYPHASDDQGYRAYVRLREPAALSYLLKHPHKPNLSLPHENGDGDILKTISKFPGVDQKYVFNLFKKEYPDWNPKLTSNMTAETLFELEFSSLQSFNATVSRANIDPAEAIRAFIQGVLPSKNIPGQALSKINFANDLGARCLETLRKKGKIKNLWLETSEGLWPHLALYQITQQDVNQSIVTPVYFAHGTSGFNSINMLIESQSTKSILASSAWKDTDQNQLLQTSAAQNPEKWLAFTQWIMPFLEQRYGLDNADNLENPAANDLLAKTRQHASNQSTNVNHNGFHNSRAEALQSAVHGEANYAFRTWLWITLNTPELGVDWLIKNEAQIRPLYLATWGFHPTAHHLAPSFYISPSGLYFSNSDFLGPLGGLADVSNGTHHASWTTCAALKLYEDTLLKQPDVKQNQKSIPPEIKAQQHQHLKRVKQFLVTPLALYWVIDQLVCNLLCSFNGHNCKTIFSNNAHLAVSHLSTHVSVEAGPYLNHLEPNRKIQIEQHLSQVINWQETVRAALSADTFNDVGLQSFDKTAIPTTQLTHLLFQMQHRSPHPELQNKAAPKLRL